MVDFEIDKFQFVGLWALMRCNLDALVGANTLALPAGNTKILAGVRIDRESQAPAEVRRKLGHFIGIVFGDGLAEGMFENSSETFSDFF